MAGFPRTRCAHYDDELEQALIAFRDNADALEEEFDIEGDVIPMSFIINNGDQDPAILINGFGEGYGDTGDHFAVTDDGEVIYTTVQEGYKEGIEWGSCRPGGIYSGVVHLCGEGQEPQIRPLLYLGYRQYRQL